MVSFMGKMPGCSHPAAITLMYMDGKSDKREEPGYVYGSLCKTCIAAGDEYFIPMLNVRLGE